MLLLYKNTVGVVDLPDWLNKKSQLSWCSKPSLTEMVFSLLWHHTFLIAAFLYVVVFLTPNVFSASKQTSGSICTCVERSVHTCGLLTLQLRSFIPPWSSDPRLPSSNPWKLSRVPRKWPPSTGWDCFCCILLELPGHYSHQTIKEQMSGDAIYFYWVTGGSHREECEFYRPTCHIQPCLYSVVIWHLYCHEVEYLTSQRRSWPIIWAVSQSVAHLWIIILVLEDGIVLKASFLTFTD